MWSSGLFVACAVCFGAADGHLLSAARVGVLFMAAVTCLVLGSFALFFLRLAQKGDSPLFRKGDSPLFQPPEKGDSPLFGKGDSRLHCGGKGSA